MKKREMEKELEKRLVCMLKDLDTMNTIYDDYLKKASLKRVKKWNKKIEKKYDKEIKRVFAEGDDFPDL